MEPSWIFTTNCKARNKVNQFCYKAAVKGCFLYFSLCPNHRAWKGKDMFKFFRRKPLQKNKKDRLDEMRKPLMKINLQLFAEGDDDSNLDSGADDGDESILDDNDFFGDDDEGDTNQDDLSTDDGQNDDGMTGEESLENPPNEDEPKYTVKFNGKEMQMPLSQLIVNAQKGLNYDHVKAEKDSLAAASAKELQALDYYAQIAGYKSRSEYVDYLLAERNNIALQNEVQSIKEKHPGVTDELAAEIAEIKIKQRMAESEQKKKQDEEKKQADDAKKLEEFLKEYPDIKDFNKEIPQEVWTEVSQGRDLLSAYRSWENKQLKTQLQTLKQNQTNKKKSIGSVKSDAPDKVVDDFLKGLLD